MRSTKQFGGWAIRVPLAMALLAGAYLTGSAVSAQQDSDKQPGVGAQALSVVAGGTQFQTIVIRRDDAVTYSNTAFANIAGNSFTIPSNTTRLVLARFSAESVCTGSGWGSVRILAHNTTTGVITELAPESGTDFAFDSGDSQREGANSWESHAMERSARLPAGSYRILLQVAVVGADTRFRLDDWSFSVNLSV